MQAWQAWKLSLVRQEGVDASSFCLAGGRGGVLMIGVTFWCGYERYMYLVQSIIKKVSFSLGKTAVVRIGMGWDGDEKDAAAAAAAATTAERSERGK